jgi:hypothetical protein
MSAERDLKIAEAVQLAVQNSVYLDSDDETHFSCVTPDVDLRAILATIPLEPVAVPEFLAGGTRYKVTFDSKQSDARIYGLPAELNGCWVALVDATDNRHMHATPQTEAQQPAQSCRKCSAYAMLVKSLEAQLSEHRQKADKYREAVATLESERQANAILSSEHPEMVSGG